MKLALDLQNNGDIGPNFYDARHKPADEKILESQFERMRTELANIRDFKMKIEEH